MSSSRNSAIRPQVGASPCGAIGSSPMASGQVEKNVQDARPRLWQPRFLKLGPDFPDLAALNDWLEQRCKELWHKIPHGRLAGTVANA